MTHYSAYVLLLSVILGSAALAPSGNAADVPLKLHWPDKADEKAAPVTFGVPFPEGALPDPSRCTLVDGKGTPIPVVLTPLSLHEDGSVRWGLLDFQRDTSHDPEDLRLRPNVPGPAPATPIRVKQSEDAIRVDTGALRFTLDRGEFRLHDLAVRDSTGGWRPVELQRKVPVIDWHKGWMIETDLEGPELAIQDWHYREYSNRSVSYPDAEPIPGTTELPAYSPDTPAPTPLPDSYKIEIDEANPLRVVVLCRGRHGSRLPHRVRVKSLLDYELRITAYAGKSYLRFAYTPIADFSHGFFVLRAIEMRWPLPATYRKWQAGTETGTEAGEITDDGRIRLLQTGPTMWTADESFSYRLIETRPGEKTSRARTEGAKAPGWLAAGDGTTSMLVAVRRFWEEHPKSLDIDSGMLRIGLWPDHFQPCPWAPAMAKTFEAVVEWTAGEVDAKSAASRVALLAERPVLAAQPEYAARTGVVGAILPQDPERFPRFEALCRQAYEGVHENRRVRGGWGMKNFGDMAMLETTHWFNGEYDPAHACVVMFLRSGDPKYLHTAEAMALHYRDIDVLHRHEDPRWVGKPIKHGEDHTGHRNYNGRWAYALGHVWLDGPLDMYCLLGDRRGLDVARLIAGHCTYTVEHETYDFIGHPPRDIGWPLIALSSIYRTTREPQYLEASKAIAEFAFRWQASDGGFPDSSGHAKTFMVGILLNGMARYHQDSGDERAERCLVEGCRWLCEVAWRPEVGGFIPTTKTPDEATPGGMRPLPALAYTYRLSEDPRLLDVLVRALDAGLEPEAQGSDYLTGKGFLTVNVDTEPALALAAEAGRWGPDRN